MADSEEQKLDLHFKEDLSSIISLLFLHPAPVRQLIKQWITVFYTMGSNIIDKQMRNRYAAFMLMQLEVDRQLSKPFDEQPPDYIDKPLVKVVGADDYIRFFEKCEKFYLMKKKPSDDDQKELEQLCMKPCDFLYRLPPMDSGVVVYGACFSKEDQ